MKTGVVVDDYKTEPFKKAFREAGYVFVVIPGITRDTASIIVYHEPDQLQALTILIRDLNTKHSKPQK